MPQILRTALLTMAGYLCFPVLFAQSNATVREYTKSFSTYPYSDPDPIPTFTKFYPYFRFDGFTEKPVKQDWKVVELENEYLRVLVLPEIGGKIWSAIDKKRNEPFIYENDVIKFRDIAMRGPWTSGGIEANFGIIGHTPAVSTPVDYLVRTNDDGSASCVISNLDLLTNSVWVMEIKLPRDKAYFETAVNWHNSSGTIQPYYSWMNLAVKAADSLRFVDPGSHYIGHEGTAHNWPIDSVHNKDLSVYGQNNFGSSKSYHIIGSYAKYFGAFYPRENYGMIHFSDRNDRLGKKIFLWALSEQGRIWEGLLTDKSGQYVEIQSGRLFNQNTAQSSYTPFKQIAFLPYQTDHFSEYWYPFSGTGGVEMADLNGVFRTSIDGDSLAISISPVAKIQDTIVIADQEGNPLYKEPVNLQPLEYYFKKIRLADATKASVLRVQGSKIRLKDSNHPTLSRPVDSYADFDWKSAFGQYLLGRDAANQRTYDVAENHIRSSLRKEPAFLPSLVEMSRICYRKMDYDSAFYFAKKALSIDTYEPAANFYYALAAEAIGRNYDAKDGFEVASLSAEYRSAAYTEIAKIYFREKKYDKALEYADRSLQSNGKNLTALHLRLLTQRMLGAPENDLAKTRKRILNVNPLDHFAAFERYWKNPNETTQRAFTTAIRSELPAQTYLTLAIFYHDLNRDDESIQLLSMAPENNEVQYWLAFLNKDKPAAGRTLDLADGGNPDFIFPYRRESAVPLRWAAEASSDWKPRYYLSLLHAFRNDRDGARRLLSQVSNPPAFAPFYAFRASLYDSSETRQQQADLQRAVDIDGNQWRYAKSLSDFYLKTGDTKKALQTLQPYQAKAPDNYIVGMAYVQALMANKKYGEAEKELAKIRILPFEGATRGHELYRRTKLYLALNALRQRQYKKALAKVEDARKWPTNLGVGEPYPGTYKTTLVDKMEQAVKEAARNKKFEVNYDELEKEIGGR